jgi:molybdopterin-binding protein
MAFHYQALAPPKISHKKQEAAMTLSARNRLPGTVEEINLGGVMAHIVVRVGNNIVESVITRRSAEEMKLRKGDKVTAIIKSTEVMLEKE